MRILVTGHNGYIGAVMTPMLIAAGHEVVGLDSDLYAQCTFGDDTQNIPSLKKDIRDVELSDLDGFDAVLHLAGLSNDPLGDLNPELTYEINHTASVRLAKLSKEVYLCTPRIRQCLKFKPFFHHFSPLTICVMY